MRAASSWAATFLVPFDAAQAIVEPTGLRVARIAGRAALTIPFVSYVDSDLGRYNELGIGFLVRGRDAGAGGEPGRARRALRDALGVYIHHLPVDQDFTLQAGRQIWGYPKFKATFTSQDEATHRVVDVAEDGMRILTMAVKNGSTFRVPNRTPPTYTFLAGVLRRTEWQMPGVKVGTRFGGATIVLGEHPIAEELRALGLPKRALMTQTIPAMRALFGPPQLA